MQTEFALGWIVCVWDPDGLRIKTPLQSFCSGHVTAEELSWLKQKNVNNFIYRLHHHGVSCLTSNRLPLVLWQNTVDKLIKKTNLALLVGTNSWRDQFIEAITVSAGKAHQERCRFYSWGVQPLLNLIEVACFGFGRADVFVTVWHAVFLLKAAAVLLKLSVVLCSRPDPACQKPCASLLFTTPVMPNITAVWV